MKKEFPYVKAHPLIEVSLFSPKDKIKMLALVDSGADYSLFSSEVAEKLGIEIEKGKKVSLEGVKGEPFPGYRHKVPLKVGNLSFDCKIVFAKVKVALLGRDNFFLPFLITFNERFQKVLIEKH